MFTLDEAKVLVDFLDRVTITGHQERSNMNLIINKIVTNKGSETKPSSEDLVRGDS
jgi:hypothetical protein